MELDCEFDLESDKLLVLKWYKDGHEFFRYTPTAKPPIMTFPFDGVYVDVSSIIFYTSHHQLLLGINWKLEKLHSFTAWIL